MPLTITPMQVITEYLGFCHASNPAVWFLYQHIADQCFSWCQEEGAFAFEVLSQNRGVIGMLAPRPMHGPEEPKQLLSQLFAEVGRIKSKAGRFLDYIGIISDVDLFKKFTFKQRAPRRFADQHWFDVQHRKTLISHNQVHPDAVWACGADLQYSVYTKRWVYRIYYSYEWESSTWSVDLWQQRRESLWGFSKRVPEFIAKTLGTEDYRQRRRRHDLVRDRQKKTAAIKEVFYIPLAERGEYPERTAMDLLSIPGPSLKCGRMLMTKSRQRTLQRWIDFDAAAQQGEQTR